MADKPPLTEFDMVTIPSSFQIMKAMLPFLDINMQKNLSLIIRFMELKQTMDFFNYASNITTMSHSNKNTSSHNENANFLLNLLNNDDFVNSIAPYLPENYKSMISSLKMFSSMSDLFNQSNMDMSDLLGKYMGNMSDMGGSFGSSDFGHSNFNDENGNADSKTANTKDSVNSINNANLNNNVNINTDNINDSPDIKDSNNIVNTNDSSDIKDSNNTVNTNDTHTNMNATTNNSKNIISDENNSSNSRDNDSDNHNNTMNNNRTHFNNNTSNRPQRLSEADKGFSIFSNAMNHEQQKLFDEYLKQLDDLNL